MRRLLVLLALGVLSASAHETITTKLTWSREVVRLVQRRCVACHREGGAAPMSLATYEEARPWAKAIKEQVLSRRMPPWGAVKGFGEFANDASLSQEERGLVAEWVEGGAPEGDAAYLPPAAATPVTAKAPPRSGRIVRVPLGRPLRQNLLVLAIVPRGARDVASARVTATLPDGRIEPLLWLDSYSAGAPQAFVYREPLLLPQGSVLAVQGDLEGVELRVRDAGYSSKPRTGTVKATVLTTPSR